MQRTIRLRSEMLTPEIHMEIIIGTYEDTPDRIRTSPKRCPTNYVPWEYNIPPKPNTNAKSSSVPGHVNIPLLKKAPPKPNTTQTQTKAKTTRENRPQSAGSKGCRKESGEGKGEKEYNAKRADTWKHDT